MTDGYSKKIEIEKLIDSIKQLSYSNHILFSAAANAIDKFKELDYAAQRYYADILEGLMIVALNSWILEMKSLDNHTSDPNAVH